MTVHIIRLGRLGSGTVTFGPGVTIESAGHQVLGIANDEASAVQQIAHIRPDVALVDIKLGKKGDGIETAMHLKASHPVKIVFVSGYLDSQTQKRAAAAEPAGFVIKPYSAHHLLEVVSIAIAGASVA